MARTQVFDTNAVLERAMARFWNHGYAATSIADLERTMKIGRQSIYNAFGNKRSLYLAALARYAELHIDRPLRILDKPNASLPAIRRYLRMQVDSYTKRRVKCGCMVGNTAVELAPHDPRIAAQVRGYLGRIERAAAHAVGNAIDKREIAADYSRRALARHIVSTVVGLGVCAKAGLSRGTLFELVKVALSALKT